MAASTAQGLNLNRGTGRLILEGDLEELQDSETLHRVLFESIDEGVCLLERLPIRADGLRDYRFKAVNPAMHAMFGLQNLAGQTVRGKFPDEVEAWYDDLDRVLDTGQPIRIERESLPQDMVIEMSITRVVGGSVPRLLAVLRNITDRKRMQERQAFMLKLSDALRPLASASAIQDEAARLLREHFSVGWCCYVEFDHAGDTAIILKEAAREGLPSLAGRHDLTDIPEYVDFLRTGQLLNVPDFASYKLVKPRSIEQYCAIGIRSLLGIALVKDGLLVSQLVMYDTAPRVWPQQAVDVLCEVAERTWAAVERARAEESLAQELARQKQADSRKDEFLAMLGHELRNPLAPISTGLALLDRARQNADLIDSLLPMMRRQVVHLNRLVDDLLDASRVSRGTIDLRLAALNLNDSVEAAIEQVQSLFTARQQTLVVNLYAGPLPLQVQGDFERLTQVVANLLTNAGKYSPRHAKVTVTTGAEGDEAVIRVRDTGYGIPPERLEGLFEMFVQVPEHREIDERIGGLGIGLALARRLVQMHQGTIQAESAGLGHGSEFIVRLPRVGEAQTLQAQASPDPRHASRRILVVDDNVDAAMTLQTLLNLDGHQVATAFDGITALQQFEAFKPDLVLLDLGLPGCDGFEVARQIRMLPAGRSLPIVAVSGWGQKEDRRRTQEAGFNHHLTKPVDPAALLALIQQMSLDAQPIT